MRRYAIRFIHLLPGFNQLKGIMRTVYNQYDSVVLPIENWLQQRGVNFKMNAPIIDIDFDLANREKRATVLHSLAAGSPQQIALGVNDYVFITLGSMVEGSSVGTMTTPAPLNPK